MPDAVADTTALTATSPSLPDGSNHYVHLRTVRQGRKLVGERRALRPVFHRRDGPEQWGPDGDSGTAKISLRWSGVSDAASGLSTTNPYRLVYSTSASPATRCANGTPIFVGAAGQFEHQNLVAGTRYFYRLCATDKAGNVSMGAVGFAVAR